MIEKQDDKRTSARPPKPGQTKESNMSTKIIVSYDGTANEDDAIALGRVFARAGAEVSLAYVRHAQRADASRERSRRARPRSCSQRGAALFGDANVARHVVTDRSTPARPERARRARGRERRRVLLGLAHRQRPRRRRQLRTAAARGRPGRRRDRAGRPGRRREVERAADRRHRRRRRRRARDGRRARRRARRERRAGRQRRDRTCWSSTRARRPSRAASRSAPRPRTWSRSPAARCSCCRAACAAARSARRRGRRRLARSAGSRSAHGGRATASAHALAAARPAFAQVARASACSEVQRAAQRDGRRGPSTATSPGACARRAAVAGRSCGGTVSWQRVPAALQTTVTELPRLARAREVQVAPGEVEGRVERKAQQLGRELKLPGFRRGKVPAALVIQRVGREAVLDQAVRDSLAALVRGGDRDRGIVPVGDPEARPRRPARRGRARWSSRSRSACCRRRELGGYDGPGGAAPRAGGRGAADRRGDRRRARAAGAPGDRRARRRAGRLRGDRLPRLAPADAARATTTPTPSRAGAVRGRRGPRPAGRAGRRQPDSGLRGGAARRARRRAARASS